MKSLLCGVAGGLLASLSLSPLSVGSGSCEAVLGKGGSVSGFGWTMAAAPAWPVLSLLIGRIISGWKLASVGGLEH